MAFLGALVLSLLLIASMPVSARDGDQAGHGPDAFAAPATGRGIPAPRDRQLAQRGDEPVAVPAPRPPTPSGISDEEEPPALLSADEVIHDENLAVITARGNVEIQSGDRILLADTVTYNIKTKVVTASGNVSLLEPNGDVVFGDYVEITDDLGEGFIRDVRVLLKDDTKIAAASGFRTGDNKTVYRRGVFSACNVCRENPDKAPLWQIKAEKAVHDQGEARIRYNNAWMEMGGVPMLYTPYFSHPDPSVDRQSGWLTPDLGYSESLGGVAQIPYYMVVSPTSDLTLSPIITTKQGIVFAGEFRQLLPYGYHEVEASGTVADRELSGGQVEQDVLRGHVDAKGRYELSPDWRTGFDLKRSTDDTYQRLYKFSKERTLTSRLFFENFGGRSYASANGIFYQGLRAGDRNAEQPIVLPKFDYNYVSEPLFADSTVSIDTSATVLTRDEGLDTRRLSVKGGWELPYIDPIGGLYSLAVTLQTDGYWTNQFDPDEINPPDDVGSDTALRVFPQAALKWRYPWASHSEGFDQAIEPIAQVVIGTDPEQDDIPNEDSQDFAFDDTNLFSLNRFPGLDRVDPGQRLDYGLQWTGHTAAGGSANLFVGQSYRLETDNDLFAENSGVRDNLSDIVGRAGIRPISYLDLSYRYRLDKDSFAPRSHDFRLGLGPPGLNLSLSYLFVDRDSGTLEFDDREELGARLNSKLGRYWSGFVSTQRDLEHDTTLQSAVGLTYEDECFLFTVVGRRAFFVDRDIEPEDSIFLRVSFKHIGSTKTTQTIGGGS